MRIDCFMKQLTCTQCIVGYWRLLSIHLLSAQYDIFGLEMQTAEDPVPELVHSLDVSFVCKC